MSISGLLLRFIEDELDRSQGLIERVVFATLAKLQDSKDGDVASLDRTARRELADLLQQGRARFQATFVDSLRRLSMAEANGAEDPIGLEPSPGHGTLTLMDDALVESDIEISRATQLIDSAAEWELRELATFTSTLIGLDRVNVESNPMRASTYARAVWESACTVSRSPVQRSALMRITASVIARPLKLAWASACTRLESQGIEQSAYKTVVLPPTSLGGTTVARAPNDGDALPDDSLSRLLSRIPRTGTDVAPSARTTAQITAPLSRESALGSKDPEVLSAALEQALQQIESLLQTRALTTSVAASRADVPPAAMSLHELTRALLPYADNAIDRQVVELLSRLFEAMLTDEKLAAPLRSVIARLQVSALRVALRDASMLRSDHHPVWLLMNRIAAAGQVWPQPGDPRAGRLHGFCEELSSDIATASQQDAQQFVQAIARLEFHLQQELEQQQAHAQSSIQALIATERRNDLEEALRQQLGEQIRQVKTTERVRRFMTQDWARVVAESILRFGAEDPRTTGILSAVDELLWSLRVPDHPDSRTRLLQLLPGLLQRLREGMALVGTPEADRQGVLDDLMAVHTEALRAGHRSGDKDEASFGFVRQLHADGSMNARSQPVDSFSDSLIDVSSMDTVPSDLMSDEMQAASDTVRMVKEMTPGTLFRWFLSGRWRMVQLLWHSASGRFHVFASETPDRTHSIERHALERLCREGLVSPLAERSLFSSAAERVRRELDAA